MNRRLAARRLDLDLTVNGLSALAGVTPATVRRAERGEPVQPVKARRIARALELAFDELFTYDPAKDGLAYPKRKKAS